MDLNHLITTCVDAHESEADDLDSHREAVREAATALGVDLVPMLTNAQAVACGIACEACHGLHHTAHPCPLANGPLTAEDFAKAVW